MQLWLYCLTTINQVVEEKERNKTQAFPFSLHFFPGPRCSTPVTDRSVVVGLVFCVLPYTDNDTIPELLIRTRRVLFSIEKLSALPLLSRRLLHSIYRTNATAA